MKTLAQIRSYVRLHTDTDETDVPDELLDAWIADGYRTILRSRKRWEHLEATKTVTLVAGTREYSMPAGTDVVVAAFFDERALSFESHKAMTELFPTTSARGVPRYWSQWAGKIYFWPAPTVGGTATLHVIREWDKDWILNGGTPDLPSDYEGPLLKFVLAEGYKHANDFVAGQNYMADFVMLLNELNSSENQEPMFSPIIMGGGREYDYGSL